MGDSEHPYSCDIEIALRSPQQAADVRKILEVDREIGDRVMKSFRHDDDCAILSVSFRAVDAKSLRVSVSSFYEYLVVCLKCYHEFDTAETWNP
jgi:tRNA threonylcarbamoyladenosine modification (KEOPS) complex  Pcc1 subunit